ncbi:MAG: efflux RND transporter periplasmic adaptor subunit [Candidatus Pacebacteria bacterium]|nr:efflux RND transporter periplasmic adaptor subunit [Candidatus Paceibacterota bacterium]
MKKRSFYHFLKNKYTIISLVVLIIIFGYYVTHRSKAPAFESAAVAMGNVVEKVSVTGAISPLSKADLAFKKSGVVTTIPFKVGDHVKRGELIAALDNAGDIAALASAQATLADMSRGLSPEELSVQKTALDNAKKNAFNAVHDGYARAQGALVNYMDSFFTNPQSVNPNINLHTDSQTISTNINSARVKVSDILSTWSSRLNGVQLDTISPFTADVAGYLATIKSFASDLSGIVGKLSPGNSGMTQTQIDSITTTMNAGLTALNGAIDTVTAAQTALSSAQSNYDLKLAGNSSQSIASQQARVDQAQANVNDARIYSPIDGIVTKANPSVGEFVAAGQSGFAVQSDGGFKIEAYVPEADIAKVSVKNKANVTLDAYGQYVIFPATVTEIDPAETVLEGVPTYKVTLQFDAPDARIRSGMTANTDILTREVDNVLTVPTRAVVDDNGNKTIRIVNSDGKSYSSVGVTVGLKGSDGTTQVISGVSVGDKVVTYVK